jgi:hypothetical protein
MIVADPWTQMLEQLEPEYLTLKFIVEVGPKVKAILRKINFSWRVRIEEDWDNTASEDQHLYYTLDYTNLDIRCDWADQQLATWKTATRFGHQEWKFSKQKDAEKFITLFNLRWTR